MMSESYAKVDRKIPERCQKMPEKCQTVMRKLMKEKLEMSEI